MFVKKNLPFPGIFNDQRGAQHKYLIFVTVTTQLLEANSLNCRYCRHTSPPAKRYMAGGQI